MSINKETIEKVKNRVAIFDIAELFTKLKPQTGGKYLGCCPLHHEKSPSFYINTTGQRANQYKCFGCGASGDAIDLYSKANNCDFLTAIGELAAYYAIEIAKGVTSTSYQAPQPLSIQPKKYIAPELFYIPEAAFAQTLQNYAANHLVGWLVSKFGEQIVLEDLAKQYFIGTAPQGKTILWLIDKNLNICTGRIFEFDRHTGKRNRKVDYWVHNQKHKGQRLFKGENENYKTCLFGEHLLGYAKKPIALYESGKSALCGAAVQPDLHHLSTDGAAGLTLDKTLALAGQDIILMVDADYTGRSQAGLVPQFNFITAGEEVKKEVHELVMHLYTSEYAYGYISLQHETRFYNDLVDFVETNFEGVKHKKNFVSNRQKLEAVGCQVTVCDLAPEKIDGTDIADEV